MADNSIRTSCTSIFKYFSEIAQSGNKFVIPNYQRPYSWDEDHIQTLFDDIVDFMDQLKNSDNKNEQKYFLGSVVTYANKTNNEQELIDGQQRITSLFLLLRYIYETIGEKPDPSFSILKSDLERSLWVVDCANNKFNKEDIIIESKAVSDNKSEYLKKILISGKAEKKDKDRYSKNYRKIIELYDEFCLSRRDMISSFVNTVLHKVVLLPIESPDEEFALRIFSTLNDRGLPLSDADIFKARCYSFKDAQKDKDAFVKKWKSMEEDADDASVGLQSLFYYYMFYLRAGEGDTTSTTPGIRKYYAKNEYAALKKDDLMSNLEISLKLWQVVNQRTTITDEPWSENNEILKLLDILNAYPNDFWKYPTNIFYIKYHLEKDFEQTFARFLKMLIAKLIKYNLEMPGISNIKVPILKLGAEVFKTSNPTFLCFDKKLDINKYKDRIIEQPNKKFVRMLLLTISYAKEKQKELIPFGWQIEHIFPQTWDEHIYLPEGCGYTADYVYKMIEHLGNKAPIEKIVNIRASNNYFNTKKREYSKSKINEIALLREENDWTLDSIKERDVNIVKDLNEILDNWEKGEIQKEIEKSNNSNPYLDKMLEEGKISKEDYDNIVKGNK